MAIHKMKKVWEYIDGTLQEFRCCFSREATFQWFLVAVIGMMVRSDHHGVTSIVRELIIDPNKYTCLIHFFHSSGWTLEKLQKKWINIIQKSGNIFRLDGLIVLLGDGVKQAKEATRMPGVKKLRQESEDSSKSEYIRGHMFGGLGVLVGGLAKQFCLPLSLCLHDGVKTIQEWDNSEYKEDSHVSRLVREACKIAQTMNEQCLLLLDRYFLTQPALKSITEATEDNGGKSPVILITRPKDNYTAWFKPDPQPALAPEGGGTAGKAGKPKRGPKPKTDKESTAPKKEKPPLGEKVKIFDLFRTKAKEFTKTTLMLYGDCEEVGIFYANLFWGRDLFQELRFVFVNRDGDYSVFVSTALDMDPGRIVELYCYRFKIETFFRAFKQTMSGFGYHFWTRRMPAFNIFATVEAMEQKIQDVTAKVSKDSITTTLNAIEGFVMFACIAMGIIQLCSLRFTNEINHNENRWMRTNNKGIPAEETTMVNLRFALPYLFHKCQNLALVKAIKARQADKTTVDIFDEILDETA